MDQSGELIPVVLSILWPGLGHLYISKPRGIFFFIAWLFLLPSLLNILTADEISSSILKDNFFLITLILILWIVVLVDITKRFKKSRNLGGSFINLAPFLIIIIIYIFFSLPLKMRKPKAAVGNLNTHSTCSDGKANYDEIIDKALKLGFNFIAFTDNHYWSQEKCPRYQACNLARCKEVAEKCANEQRLLCLLGQEIAGKVNILAIGTKSHISPNQPVATIVEQIQRQGGLAIVSNPEDKNDSKNPSYLDEFSSIQLARFKFDAMECGRVSFSENSRQKEITDYYGLPCVYSSQAKTTQMLANIYNQCEIEIKSFNDLKKAVKTGQCKRFTSLNYLISGIFSK